MRGLDVIGFDYSTLFSTLFQAGGGAIDYAQQVEAEKKAAAGASGALADAIAADQAATSALSRMGMSGLVANSDPTPANKRAFNLDKTAADKAVAVQDKAGALVPEDKRADRVKAAQGIVDNATKNLSGKTGSAQLVAQVHLDAAKMTLSKAKGESPDKGKSKDEGKGEGEVGFFSKSIVGPVKVWHGLIAVLVAGIGVVVLKKKSQHT